MASSEAVNPGSIRLRMHESDFNWPARLSPA